MDSLFQLLQVRHILNANQKFCVENQHALILCDLWTPEGHAMAVGFVESDRGKRMGATLPPNSDDPDQRFFFFTQDGEQLKATGAFNIRTGVLNVIAYDGDTQTWRNHYFAQYRLEE